jgi:hypothetical protein
MLVAVWSPRSVCADFIPDCARMDIRTGQRDLFETDETRALLDQLLTDARLYRTGSDYQDLLEFVVRLRNMAPFNAMLLQVQKPGIRFAASALDWEHRFGRTIRDGARPLLILWPFGPVATVYDVQDTEGKDLPEDVNCFVARGEIDSATFDSFAPRLARKNIQWREFDGGDGKAGSIRVLRRGDEKKEKDLTTYRMMINRNHSVPVRFVTLAHELGHLYLGHLGHDGKLSVPKRRPLTHSQRELEAESVAYIVAERNGIESKSHSYLANFVRDAKTVDDLDVYQIMRAAGQVEMLLGLISHTRFKPQRSGRAQRRLLRAVIADSDDEDGLTVCHL